MTLIFFDGLSGDLDLYVLPVITLGQQDYSKIYAQNPLFLPTEVEENVSLRLLIQLISLSLSEELVVCPWSLGLQNVTTDRDGSGGGRV